MKSQPMVLALDVGNTNITIGCISGEEIPHVFRMATDTSKTSDEYAVHMKGILEFGGVSCKNFEGAVISSVVPPLTRSLRQAVQRLTGHDAVVVGAGVKTGLNIMIDDPGQLGSDMVATAVSACAGYAPPVIIVDMGTATKITVIDKNARFIGGAIMPGISISQNALSAGTSQLPRVPIEAPDRCICANTIDCMKSGAIFGSAAMIDGMIERFEHELGSTAVVVATGGLAGMIYKHCRREITYDPQLLLRGLRAIYQKNKKTR